MLIFLLVGIANVLDVQVIGTGSVLRTAVIFFYISNEGVSLLENAANLGLPVPEKIKIVLEQLHDRVLWCPTPSSVRTTPGSVRTVSTASRHTAWSVSYQLRASAHALPVRPDRQAAITALAKTAEFLSAWRKRTAAGVLHPMPMTSVPSPSSVPVIC